jgi:hypothetical protein
MPKIIFKKLILEPPKSRTRRFGFDAACDELLTGAGFFWLEQILQQLVGTSLSHHRNEGNI